MIYTITLNPAIDHILNIKGELTRGKTNRIQESSCLDVGGKGTHVSVGLKLLGYDNLCSAILGEKDSERFEELLNQYQVETSFLKVEGQAMRHNYVLVDESNKGSLMAAEYGFPIKREIMKNFINSHLTEIKADDIVIISGNPSKDTPMEVFEYLLDVLVERKVRLVADVSGEFLKTMLRYPLLFAKPNSHELGETLACKINSLEECYQVYLEHQPLLKNIEYLAVSMGAEGSIFLKNESAYIFYPPKVKTINDTGSGDAYVAGVVAAIVNGKSLSEIGRLATAVGASKALEFLSTGFDVDKVDELLEQVAYRKLGQ